MEEAVMQELRFKGLGVHPAAFCATAEHWPTDRLARRAANAKLRAMRGDDRVTVRGLVSEQAHYCVDRAVRVMGWGAAGTVGSHRATIKSTQKRVKAHAEAIDQGMEVIAGLATPARLRQDAGRFGDAGLICAAKRPVVPRRRRTRRGAHLLRTQQSPAERNGAADSVAMDFHKMLGVPACAQACSTASVLMLRGV